MCAPVCSTLLHASKYGSTSGLFMDVKGVVTLHNKYAYGMLHVNCIILDGLSWLGSRRHLQGNGIIQVRVCVVLLDVLYVHIA